jgi:hypothetical protein
MLEKLASFNKYILAAIIIVIIVIFWNIATVNTSNYEDYLYGLWVGDDNFCEEADIQSILVFIGEPESCLSGMERNGYVIIQYDDNDVYNQGFTMNYSRDWAGPGVPKYTICADIDFDEEQMWTEDGRVKITTDMKTGVMRIHYDGQLYAKLYKDNTVSNVMVWGVALPFRSS